MNAVSLFSNVGIAEVYLESIGINVLFANEIDKKRAECYKHFYPNTEMIVGDISKKDVLDKLVKKSLKSNIDILFATPPCQGMSVAGIRNKYDERNHLIKYVIEYILKVKPKYVFLENVIQQLNTPIIYRNVEYKIPDYITKRLGKYYYINEEKKVNTKDYGIPQDRKRAIILLTRKDQDVKWVFPPKEDKVITLREAIGHLPSLFPLIREEKKTEAKSEIHKFHKQPVHARRHVEAMMHTPTGKSAWENKIYYPKKADGTKSKGYNTTYHRMYWDKPAPTVTRYNGVMGSQMNVHPGRLLPDGTYSDPRVLTIYEIMIISSLPDDWNPPEWASDNFIREVIGEGIPPLLVKKICETII